VVKVLIYNLKLFIFSTPMLIRHLWQLNTVIFLLWCLIRTFLLQGLWHLAADNKMLSSQDSLKPGKSCLRTVDLLVLISLDQLLLIMKILFTCFTKQAILMWRSTVLSLLLQLVLPA
jgi:hypothetical protein